MIFTVFISVSVVHYALCLRVHTDDAVVPGATTSTQLLLLTVAFQRLSLKNGALPPPDSNGKLFIDHHDDRTMNE